MTWANKKKHENYWTSRCTLHAPSPRGRKSVRREERVRRGISYLFKNLWRRAKITQIKTGIKHWHVWTSPHTHTEGEKEQSNKLNKSDKRVRRRSTSVFGGITILSAHRRVSSFCVECVWADRISPTPTPTPNRLRLRTDSVARRNPTHRKQSLNNIKWVSLVWFPLPFLPWLPKSLTAKCNARMSHRLPG